MFTLFRRFLSPAPRTRLSEAEVRALADGAGRKASVSVPFTLVSVRSVDGRLTWTASTPTKGKMWSVTIDDATGEVGEVSRAGFR